MNNSFEFLNALVLSDDELLVINGGKNEITCGAGCGVGCGGGCGQGCTGCQVTPEVPTTPPVRPV